MYEFACLSTKTHRSNYVIQEKSRKTRFMGSCEDAYIEPNIIQHKLNLAQLQWLALRLLKMFPEASYHPFQSPLE
ncbi:hypothetical protein ACTXT7_005683 [Hymenolepis weldensis]